MTDLTAEGGHGAVPTGPEVPTATGKAARRRAMRSALAGPLPEMTRLNSSQSIWPNR